MGELDSEGRPFYASVVFRMCMWAGVFVAVVSAVLHTRDPPWLSAIFGLCQLSVAVGFGLVGWTASTKALFIASSSGIAVRQFGGELVSIKWADVRGLKWENRGAMCLALAEGNSVTLSLLFLGSRERSILREEVRRRLDKPEPSGGAPTT